MKFPPGSPNELIDWQRIGRFLKAEPSKPRQQLPRELRLSPVDFPSAATRDDVQEQQPSAEIVAKHRSLHTRSIIIQLMLRHRLINEWLHGDEVDGAVSGVVVQFP